MANSAENEVRGIPTIGNPDVSYRSADRGPEGDGSIGNRLPGGILVRGNPDKLRNQMVIYRSDSKLRGTGR